MPPRLLTPTERIAARVVTGPLAHLWSGLADWATLLARWLSARARTRASGRARP